VRAQRREIERRKTMSDKAKQLTEAVKELKEAQRRVLDLFRNAGVDVCILPELPVHIFSGIDKLAEIYGADLVETPLLEPDESRQYSYTFEADGIKYFSFYRE